MKQGIRPQMDPSVPAPVENLIKSCWAANPAERPEFERIFVIIYFIYYRIWKMEYIVVLIV
jgi:hypothetical protein